MYLTENWRLKAQRYTLTGSRDPQDTEAVNFPPRPVQPRMVETFDFHTSENPPQVTQPVDLALEVV